MGILSQAIDAALRSHNVPQAAGTGTSPLAEALRSLLAPRSTATGEPADAAAPEPDALQALLARFQQGGYADIIRSWISSGQNQQIEPHQLNEALGPTRVAELAEQTGLPHQTLLSELARVLPIVIDRLTPQGRMPAPDSGSP